MYMRSIMLCLALAASAAADPSAAAFSHADLDSLLRRVVDADGGVDYARLASSPDSLQQYVQRLAQCSPSSCPESDVGARFPTRSDSLAYWINAYNALVLHAVVVHWPLASVGDVEGGLDGFFRHQRFVVGGDSLSLDDIENGIIRPQFRDPRIHFAVNCGARSCPALDDEAFHAATLSTHLDRQTRRFASDPEHVRWADGQLHLSRILEWYGSDFVEWTTSTTVSDYVRSVAPAALATKLPASAVPVRFMEYDWSLNTQSGALQAE